MAQGIRAHEWTQVSPHRLQRKLRGFELIINLTEHYNDGNCQLICATTLETDLRPAELEARARAAWLCTRQKIPLLGVALYGDQLDVAVFEALQTLSEAESWADSTCHLVEAGISLEEVTRRCKTAAMDDKTGKMIQMYLVARPSKGPMGIVLHTSHVLNGHFLLKIFEAIGHELTQGKGHEDISSSFEAEDVKAILPKLPVSAVHAYECQYSEPTAEETGVLAQQEREAASRSSKSSVGIPVRHDWQQRSSIMRDHTVRLDSAILANIKAGLKRQKLTLTTALFACITAASAQVSHDQDMRSDGAHLLFSLHTKRWFPPDDALGHTVSMGVVPASLWLDSSNASRGSLRSRSRTELATLAHEIQDLQSREVDSPHVINHLDAGSRSIYTSVLAKDDMPAAVPHVSKPTLTSQGVLELQEFYSDEYDGGSWLRFSNFEYGGRHSDPSVCFALQVFRGELRVIALWDEKFFDTTTVHTLLADVVSLFLLLACGSEQKRLDGLRGGNIAASTSKL
ncbi:unnamed protein product [Parajaminaea phylloscopi]